MHNGDDEVKNSLTHIQALSQLSATGKPFVAVTMIESLGSTPQEIDRAILICEQGGGRDRECAREIFADERLRTVTLTPFEIDQNEITNADFKIFVDETDYTTTAEERGYSWDITRCRRCSCCCRSHSARRCQ